MSSSVRQELEGFVAGRVKAERLVLAVATAYYGDGGRGKRDGLGPLIEVIDRASPGIVELGIVPGGPGFEIRLAERPFPKQYQTELMRAAETVLTGMGNGKTGRVVPTNATGLWAWIRRLFRSPRPPAP